jgi:hypothetical protein
VNLIRIWGDKMNLIPDEEELKYRIAYFRGVNQEVDEQNLEVSDSPFAYGYNTDDGNLSTIEEHGLVTMPINEQSTEIRTLNGVPNCYRVENLMAYYKHDIDTGAEESYIVAQTNLIEGKSRLYYIKMVGENIDWTYLAESASTRNAYANYRYKGEDIFIFGNDQEYLRQWNGKNVSILGNGAKDDPPKLGALTIHYERLWGCVMTPDVFRVWYSDDLDPTNWTIAMHDAGFVDLVDQSGKNVTLLSAFDSIYVFKRYGIKRIFGTYPGEFEAMDVLSTNSAIEPKTVVNCVNSIIYTAADGIYLFNGVEAVPISNRIQKFFSNVVNIQLACATFFNNKYIVALPIHYPGEEEPTSNNTVIEYDVLEGTFKVLKNIFVNDFLVVRLHNCEKLIYATNGAYLKEYVVREKNQL